MRKFKLLIIIMALGMLSVANAQDSTSGPVHYFSLQEALDYAEKNNVQVKNALEDIKLQEQVNREVTGTAYPQLSGSGQIAYNPATASQRVPNFFPPLTIATLEQLGVLNGKGVPIKSADYAGVDWGYIPFSFGQKWNAAGGVSLSQILFDGQVFTGLQARKTLIEMNYKKAEVTQEQIRATVAKLYYQLSISNTQIALLDSNIALVNKNIHDTKIMYDNGFAEGLEIDKLKVNLANLISQRTRAINQINNGYLGLKVLMGMPVTDRLVLTDKITDENLKDGVLEALEFDYTKRKEYQLAQIGAKLNEYEIQRYKYSKFPSLALNANYNKVSFGQKFGEMIQSKWQDNSTISLGMKVPIFSGFATNARIEQAKIKLRKSQNEMEALKNNIDNERLTAVNNFRSAITDLDFQKQNMALAEKVYQQTKKKYEIGTGTQIEIDAARLQLQAAQTNYYNAMYNAVISRVDFLKATGTL